MGKSTKKPKVEEDEVYHVEVITRARVAEVTDSSSEEEVSRDKTQARWEYYVKWAGYDSDSNSWEPEENVANCQRLLSSFWDHIGMDNDDYPVGYEVRAKEQWIKKELKFFAKEYKGQEKMKQQAEREHQKKHSKRSTTTTARSATSSSVKGKGKSVDIELTSSDSDGDQPLSQLVPAKRKTKTDEEEEPKSPPPKAQKIGSSSRRVTPNRGPSSSRSVDSLFTPPPEVVPKPPPAKVHPIPLPPAPVKKPTQPVKSRRPPNQHADIAAGMVDLTSVGPSSAISTKQRLRQQALNPVLPKNASLPLLSSVESDKGRRPSLTSTKNAIRELNFKKNPQNTPSPAIPNATTEFTAGSSTVTDTLASTSWVASSVRGPRDPKPQAEPVPMEDVHTFLTELTQENDSFQALAAPLTPRIEIDHGPRPPMPLASKSHLPPVKIPHKWKWSGQFVLENSDGHTESFDVTIQDCTEPTSAGLPFSFIVNGVEKLVAQTFHDIADVVTFLRACQPASQLGRVTAQNPQDSQATVSLTTLSLYMAKRKQIIFIPAFLDGEVVGHMLLFAPDKVLCQRFNVPSDLRRSQSLVIALLPWELSTKQMALDWRTPVSRSLSKDLSIQPTMSDPARWERSIRSKVSYHHALRILQLPKELDEFMAREGRTFFVWWDGGDSTNIRGYAGIETNYLLSVMEQYRALPGKGLGRVVFIHVGALKTVHKMPLLADTRAKNLSVRFYTYGTHESVVPEVWGIREIWPCGGIITFTPQAALDDLLELLRRIQQVDAHPFWASYVLPSVVGMTARLICGDEDPIAVYDRGDFAFNPLLVAIAAGEIAMITAPRNDQQPISASDLSPRWLEEYIYFQPDTEREILQYALTSFNTNYSNIRASEWMRVITEEVSADLIHMQRQPAFMKDYRRYVVLGEIQQEISVHEDGLEWVTPSDFDFKDEFYPRQ